MITPVRFGVAGIILVSGLALTLQATPVTIDVSATIALVDGDYTGEISLTQTMFGTFVFDTDGVNANLGALIYRSASRAASILVVYLRPWPSLVAGRRGQ